MDVLKEFLATSTIHGLSRVGSSRSKVSQFLWFAIVVAGFTGAGILIQGSFSSWNNSPVATSISTHSITDLQFPNITVCPPEGTNTALNYDLWRISNRTLNREEKDQLSKANEEFFVTTPHQNNADIMIATINEENLRNVYEGHQSYPIYGESPLETQRTFPLSMGVSLPHTFTRNIRLTSSIRTSTLNIRLKPQMNSRVPLKSALKSIHQKVVVWLIKWVMCLGQSISFSKS